MAHQLEVRVFQQVCDVVFGAGEEVVQADDIVAVVQQAFAQVRAEETGAAGDKGARAVELVFQFNAPIIRLILFRPASIKRLVNEKP
jgi:hypothetical protein